MVSSPPGAVVAAVAVVPVTVPPVTAVIAAVPVVMTGILAAVAGRLVAEGIPAAVAGHVVIAGVQAAAMVVVPRTTDAPPPTEWPKQEIAVETLHHLVYAVTAGAVYSFLTRSERKADELN